MIGLWMACARIILLRRQFWWEGGCSDLLAEVEQEGFQPGEVDPAGDLGEGGGEEGGMEQEPAEAGGAVLGLFA
ncbi:MAG: hypothetical protein RI897_4355 [Verrucomicrobiota bacterium]